MGFEALKLAPATPPAAKLLAGAGALHRVLADHASRVIKLAMAATTAERRAFVLDRHPQLGTAARMTAVMPQFLREHHIVFFDGGAHAATPRAAAALRRWVQAPKYPLSIRPLLFEVSAAKPLIFMTSGTPSERTKGISH